MKKYLPHLLVALAIVTVTGAGISYAHGDGNQEGQHERRAQMQAQHEETLEQAVKDGKLTEDQKSLLSEKRTEMRAEREDLTRDERHEQRGEHREAMHSWAEENNIDLSAIQGLGNGKGFARNGFGSDSK